MFSLATPVLIAMIVFVSSLVSIWTMLYVHAIRLVRRHGTVLPTAPEYAPGETWFSIDFLSLTERAMEHVRNFWQKILYRVIIAVARVLHKAASRSMHWLRRTAERLEHRLEHR